MCCRLAHVLGVKEAVLCGQQAVDAIEEGRMDTALHWCRSVMSPMEHFTT